MKVLGLIGAKQAGKDLTFKMFEKLGKKGAVKRIAFADDLKAEVAELLNVPLEDIEENKAFYRPFLQWWGYEWRRKGPKGSDNYWVDGVEDQLSEIEARDKAEGTETLVILTDVRFPNEAKLVRDFGGKIVKVVRNGHFPEDGHASETSAGDIVTDFTVFNPGDCFDTLEYAVLKAATSLDLSEFLDLG